MKTVFLVRDTDLVVYAIYSSLDKFFEGYGRNLLETDCKRVVTNFKYYTFQDPDNPERILSVKSWPVD
jgi:hypothetical protein